MAHHPTALAAGANSAEPLIIATGEVPAVAAGEGPEPAAAGEAPGAAEGPN